MSEDEPKSAIEIAMEKLKARGDFDAQPLSDEQKVEIADIRSLYKSKIAELEIKQRDKISKAASHEEIQTLQEELAQERTRLNDKTESEVKKVRKRKS